jgi:multidrug resistance efflux pump
MVDKKAESGAPDSQEAINLDDARSELKRLRATAPGLKMGRRAIDEHAAAVEQARERVAQAEREYQRSMGSPVGPYVGRGLNMR